MNGYIKYFENNGKNVSFRIEDDSVLIKCNEIWNRIKELLSTNFHIKPVYDEKYIKTKVKIFNDVVHTIFGGDKIPKEGIHYTCIIATNIDSVMKMDKKYYPLVYLEECRYEIKKKKMIIFIDAELELEDLGDFDFEQLCFNCTRGTSYTREPQTRDLDKFG